MIEESKGDKPGQILDDGQDPLQTTKAAAAQEIGLGDMSASNVSPIRSPGGRSSVEKGAMLQSPGPTKEEKAGT